MEVSSERKKKSARKLHLNGVVQGVGFRPLVYRLACRHNVKGWVLNSSAGLEIWAEGFETDVDAFCHELWANPPRLAQILQHTAVVKPVYGYTAFEIRHSESGEEKEVLISPDVAVCEDCCREIMNPDDPRYQYPFTNCTNCGPRYTIIEDIPYDRQNTTMRDFPMCDHCEAEYLDPSNRRFHAQPNACPACGPKIELWDCYGQTVFEKPNSQENNAGLLMDYVRSLLRQGNIIAIKGLGGFHLSCDALNTEAVRRLRIRKRREYKPFAVMARDLETVRRYCRLSPAEEELVSSPAAPIVIMDLLTPEVLPQWDRMSRASIAPGLSTLGVMLPYTPLHHLLFEPGLELLVMTSANISDNPLISDNHQALSDLAGIADYFVVHNRNIYQPCDDSLVRVTAGRTQFYRRARGFVPFPISLSKSGPEVLGLGGEMKNALCLTKKDKGFFSQHLGDLNHWGNYQQFLTAIPNLGKLLEIVPQALAYDLHPAYAATRYALGREDIIRVGVQHHHAHLAACLAENGQEGPVLGVICDGTGYGTDGTLWGFEFMLGDYCGYTRLASLRPIPLPGGEASILRPMRMAWTYLYCFGGEQILSEFARVLTKDLSEEELCILRRQVDKRVNTWDTSSCGRLFDAVSAFLGVCVQVNYEGQAAVELETLAASCRYSGEKIGNGFYPFPLVPVENEGDLKLREEKPQIILPQVRDNFKPDYVNEGTFAGASKAKYWLDPEPLWQTLLEDYRQGTDRPLIARRFHQGVIDGIVLAVQKLCGECGVKQVVLSGGTFHNRILFSGIMEKLTESGLSVLTNRLVPPNDGGLALGQAMIAREVLRKYRLL